LKKLITITTLALTFVGAPFQTSHAEGDYGTKNKVFFRAGYSQLSDSRGNEVFTDTNSAGNSNNGSGGFSIAAGLDLGMTDNAQLMHLCSLAGEVRVEFSRFSKKSVIQTTSALLGAPTTSDVNVTELNVGISPKLRFDTWGRFKPYIVPVGLSFLVSSPPSNDTTYLDIGINTGVGFDVMLVKWLSLGADFRYTYGFETNNTETSYFSVGGGVGLHF